MSADACLVTGGAGFIGSHLVSRLLGAGADVRVLDDLSRGSRDNLGGAEGCELIVADVRDADAVHRAAKGVRTIYHLGAVPSVVESVAQPTRTNAVNVEGTLNVLDAARACGVDRVVFAASCAAYGDATNLPLQESERPRPSSPYALQKVTSEEYSRLYGELYGLEVVALRFFNVYGPRQDPYGDYAAVVPRFALAAAHGEPVHVYGDGEQTRDFVYVEDVARACELASRADGAAHQVINVASGVATSINQLVEAVGHGIGAELDVVRLDERPGEVRHSVADTTLAERALGFEPEFDLSSGLRATIEDLRSRVPAPAAAAQQGEAR